jgi:hypothetical protein
MKRHRISPWPGQAPADCPFPRSDDFFGLDLTGGHAENTEADTWYPAWAADGKAYHVGQGANVGQDSRYAYDRWMSAQLDTWKKEQSEELRMQHRPYPQSDPIPKTEVDPTQRMDA